MQNKYYYQKGAVYDRIKNVIIKKNTCYLRKYDLKMLENTKSLCPTLMAAMGAGGNNIPVIKDNYGIRKIIPRECANFQGFPQSYMLPAQVYDCQLYKQIGNTVSIPVVSRIAKQIKIAIKDYFII